MWQETRTLTSYRSPTLRPPLVPEKKRRGHGTCVAVLKTYRCRNKKKSPPPCIGTYLSTRLHAPQRQQRWPKSTKSTQKRTPCSSSPTPLRHHSRPGSRKKTAARCADRASLDENRSPANNSSCTRTRRRAAAGGTRRFVRPRLRHRCCCCWARWSRPPCSGAGGPCCGRGRRRRFAGVSQLRCACGTRGAGGAGPGRHGRARVFRLAAAAAWEPIRGRRLRISDGRRRPRREARR